MFSLYSSILFVSFDIFTCVSSGYLCSTLTLVIVYTLYRVVLKDVYFLVN